MPRTMFVAALLLFAGLACQQHNPPTTPLAVPIRPATQSDEQAALAAAVKEKLAKLQRQQDEIKAMTAALPILSPDTATEQQARDAMAKSGEVADKYALLIRTCDEVRAARERYERAAGVQPDGQSLYEMLDTIKRGANLYIDLVNRNRRDLDK